MRNDDAHDDYPNKMQNGHNDLLLDINQNGWAVIKMHF